MSSPASSTTELNDCGCCEGISVETPAQVFNRPGLSAIAYRVGAHAQFKESLLARLSGSHQPALRSLTTRDDDDFSIALLDAWATVADVLTFYQERIANEAYLRTAVEHLSVLELARLIDYQLRHGVAAGTYLAFTLEDAPGALGQAIGVGTTAQLVPATLPPINIASGVKVMSIPGPGEQAQTFETVEEIEARPEWNAIRPRLTQPQNLPQTQTLLDALKVVVLEGTASELKTGNRLLVVNEAGHRAVKTSLSVTIETEAATTLVEFVGAAPPAESGGGGGGGKASGVAQVGQFTDFGRKVELNENVVSLIKSKTWSEGDLSALALLQGWSVGALVNNIEQQAKRRPFTPEKGVFAFRQRAALFGHNAPKQPTYTDKNVPKKPSEWDEWTLDAQEADNKLFLDNAYDAIKPGSYITIDKPGKPLAIFQVAQVEIRPRTAYGISSKTTVLTLSDGDSWASLLNGAATTLGDLRDISVYAQSEQLTLADVPVEDSVQGHSVTFDRAYLGLRVGQRAILTGERSDLKGVVASETLTLKTALIEAGFTVATFAQPLANSYVRKSVVVNANVAFATHGESVRETLGSGDATQEFQRFTLRQPPLTYVSASNPSGGQTTLEVRVNDLLWHEAPNFYGHEPHERIYVTRLDDEGKTTVIFGDGKTGARLPTGQENVKAAYRKGIGLPGLVKADQLTLLMTRPLGVKGVTNPNAATGAADREQRAEARRNAPLTVLTLDRVVSLRDYEDFAGAFSGIGKALATWTWFGEKQGVFVTVAGAGGAEVKDKSELHTHLLSAMRQAGDPRVPLQVKTYQPRFFRLQAALSIAPDFLPEKVLAEVEQKLRETYSFEARAFGQPVHLSELIGLMQNVRGVVAVDVDEFYRSDQAANRHLRIAAAFPLPGDEEVFPAELLTLDPRPLKLGVMP